MLDNLQLIPGEAFTATGSVVEKVIDKMSNFFVWMINPKQNKKYQLEAEAYLIEKIKNDDNMPELAKAVAISNVRKIIKEYSNQANILSIAIGSIDENAEPENLEDDWIAYFWEKAKVISREDIAILWGQILAKEINAPGTVSKALVHILSIIDYKDAITFVKLANFSVLVGDEYQVIVFNDRFHTLYSEYGLSSNDLISLEEAGLVQNSIVLYELELDEDEKVIYFDNEIELNNARRICIGNTLLTKAGRELMSIITNKRKIDKFEKILADIGRKDLAETVSDMLDKELFGEEM